MKLNIFFYLLFFILLSTNCKKDDFEGKSYLTLNSGQSAYETYESIQALYEKQAITDLFVEDSFSALITAKHFLSLYYDFVIRDSVHPDTMHEFKFHFEDDTLNSILLLPQFTSVEQWPTYQVSTTILYPGIDIDSIYENLNLVNKLDTFERIINIYLDYKNLDKRFSNNMYNIDSWFATEIADDNQEYIIELTFKKGVLYNIDRTKK